MTDNRTIQQVISEQLEAIHEQQAIIIELLTNIQKSLVSPKIDPCEDEVDND